MKFSYWHVEPVLDLIGKYESRGDYGIVYGGIPKGSRPKSLTDMTINDVIEWQRRVVNAGAKSSAAGKYQIIRKTLMSSVAATGINESRKFDKSTQDELGMHLLRIRGMQSFLEGKIDAEDMAIALAKEWASFPVPRDMNGASRFVRRGQSYYSGDGLNKAHATPDEVDKALYVARERFRAKPDAVAPVAPTPESAGSAGLVAMIIALIRRIFGK